eukprot:COSAG01_NODE_3124_length_6550_cov_213.272981_2_plen_54_part_00
MTGNLEMMRWLEAQGVDMHGEDALMCAAVCGHLAVVQWLRELGVGWGVELEVL